MSVNTQRLFSDQDLQLIEFPQKHLFELSDESRAALSAKIQGGHDDDLIEIEQSITLPNSLLRRAVIEGGRFQHFRAR